MSRKSQSKRKQKRQKRKAQKPKTDNVQKPNPASVTEIIQIEGDAYDVEEIGAWLFHSAVNSKQKGLSHTSHMSRLGGAITERWPEASVAEVDQLMRRGRGAADLIYGMQQVVVLE